MAEQKPLMPARQDPSDLLGTNIINTGPFAADGKVKRVDWKNTSGKTIQIVKSRLWLGCDGGLVCDACADLVRDTDNALVATMQADHYKDESHGAAIESFDFAPYYVTLAPGEQLILLCWGNDYKGGRGHVHFAAFVWFKYG